VKTDERLYRLGELTPPSPAPGGSVRLAETTDRELLLGWSEAFMREAGVVVPPDLEALVDRRLADRAWHVWEHDGRPVSFAGASPVVAGMSRVGPVFTPPELRGRGYAGAVVTAASAYARTAGASEVLLYTDLSNPTSNALYQRLGYRPVEDSIVLDLC